MIKTEQKQNKLSKLPLTSDYVFRRIFGQEENKSALIDFLESILEIKIEKLEINNPEIPKEFYDSKYSVLDLKVTLNDNTIVNVEVQLQNQHNMEQRSTYYMAKTYAMQLSEREEYENCKKVVVIDILNFKYYKRNSYHSIAKMIFEECRENERVDMGYENEDKYATKYLEMHIIELPKFRKKNPEISTKLEQWLYLFIGEENAVRKISKENKEIEKINKKLASMSLSREERNNYEFRLKAILDERSAIGHATRKGIERGMQKGMQKGIQKGIQQGLEQSKTEIAREMIKEKIPIETIIKITKLTKEEIEKL